MTRTSETGTLEKVYCEICGGQLLVDGRCPYPRTHNPTAPWDEKLFQARMKERTLGLRE